VRSWVATIAGTVRARVTSGEPAARKAVRRSRVALGVATRSGEPAARRAVWAGASVRRLRADGARGILQGSRSAGASVRRFAGNGRARVTTDLVCGREPPGSDSDRAARLPEGDGGGASRATVADRPGRILPGSCGKAAADRLRILRRARVAQTARVHVRQRMAADGCPNHTPHTPSHSARQSQSSRCRSLSSGSIGATASGCPERWM